MSLWGTSSQGASGLTLSDRVYAYLRVLEVSIDTLVPAFGVYILGGLGHRCLRAELGADMGVHKARWG